MILIQEYTKCKFYLYVEGMQYRAVIYKDNKNFDIPLKTDKYEIALEKVKTFILS